MFKLVGRAIDRICRSMMTTRQQILAIIYLCYVWDAVRTEYIESRRRYYELYCVRRSSPKQRTKASRPRQVPSDFMVHRHEEDRDDLMADYSDHCGPNTDRSVFDEHFECPLPDMSEYIRTYQLVSTTFVAFALFRYALLSSITYGWLGIDATYACYLPGRLGVLIDASYEAPWFGLLFFGFHSVWRQIWYLRYDRLKLDCLLFLCYDRDTILDKHIAIDDMNDRTLPGQVVVRKYLCNKVFYEKHLVARGRTLYVMKQHRTIAQYERLESLLIKFRLAYLIVVTMFVIPIFIIGLRHQLSSEFIEHSYPQCRSSTGSWLFVGRYKYLHLTFDILDNMVFIIESSLAIVVPYTGSLLVTHDLTLRFDALCDRIAVLNESMRCKQMATDHEDGIMRPPLTKRLIESLEEESNSIFNETISTFEQVQSVDQYIRRFTSFAFFANYSTCLTLLALLIFRRSSMQDGLADFYTYTLIYLQFVFVIVILYFVKPHSRSLLLYKRLCSAMALCPNIEDTKMSWRWLLEYYQKNSKRSSLHMFGESYALSSINILRCTSWFITSIVILLNLINIRLLIRGSARLG